MEFEIVGRDEIIPGIIILSSKEAHISLGKTVKRFLQ